MFKFIAPFYYLYYSRLKKTAELFSLVWIYPFFIFVFLFGFYQLDLIPYIFSYLLGLTAWISVYEIGYLENDALTIRKEINPNIRIPRSDIDYIQKYFKRIVTMRSFIFVLLVLIIYILGLFSTEQLFIFLTAVLFGRLMFFVHNRFRSRINIATYFFLCMIKYCVFPLVYFWLEFGFEPYLAILLSFPILRTIEHAVKKKYNLVKFQSFVGNFDSFRVKYYGLLLGSSVILYFFSGENKILVYSLSYFFLFRLGVLLLIGTGRYSRESIS